MNKEDIYFKNLQYIGDLKMSYIIFHYEYPILFTCTDKNNTLYLCVCCEIRKEQRWIITQTNNEELLKMLEDKITIREAFINKKFNHYIVRYYGEGIKETCEKVKVEEIDILDLPTEGEYIEAEENEFKDYIKELRATYYK